MPVDKDKPHTWVRYKKSLCRDCYGTCCTMPVEVFFDDLVRLGVATDDDQFITRGKLVNRLKKEGLIQSYRESTGKFMLSQKPNGDCWFLDSQSRLCTVYARRPKVCREFPTTMGNRPGFCPVLPKAQ